MTDPPFDSSLAEILSAAGSAHHEYEQTALKGVRDELWAGFYAAFVLGRLGDFTAASTREAGIRWATIGRTPADAFTRRRSAGYAWKCTTAIRKR